MQTDTFYWQTGAPEGLHTMTHDGSMQGHVGTALEFVMQNLGYFLQTLRDIPIGDGSLLDHCAILCTSEVAEGYSHSTTDIPILVVGRAGGALRSGIHYRSTTEESPSQVTLTMLQAVGAQVSEYGGNASATEPLSALLV
jgi:hypothetical protein